MSMKRKQILSKEEALELHHKALVIDSQQPPATNGFLFNSNMKIKLNELEQKGYKRNQAAGVLASMAAMEIHKTDEAKNRTTHNVVTVTLVASITAATRYAPLSNAIIPAIIDKTPAARTSVTISSNATHDAFDVEIPFLTM